MQDITWQEACNFSGYLKKNSPSFFKGYQNRFFRVLEGKIMAYFETETDKEPKGILNIETIIDLQVVGDKM